MIFVIFRHSGHAYFLWLQLDYKDSAVLDGYFMVICISAQSDLLVSLCLMTNILRNDSFQAHSLIKFIRRGVTELAAVLSPNDSNCIDLLSIDSLIDSVQTVGY